MRRRLSIARRSLRAAAQPVRHVIFLHRAGGQRLGARRHREALVVHRHRGLRVVGDHQAAVHAGVGGEERRQAVRAGRVEHAVGATFGDRRQLGDRRSRGSRTPSPPARRGSCRSSRPDRRGGSSGCRSRRRAPARRWCGRRRWCREPRRAPAACSAASRRPARGRRPRGGWPRSALPASRRARLRALAAWPTCGRSACRSAAKARSVPSRPSTVIAAVTSARPTSSVRSCSARHEHAEDAVGAVDQREALLGAQRDRRRGPAAAKRVGGGHDRTVGVPDLALAHQRERAVAERGEVAAGAERAVLAHDRREAVRAAGRAGGRRSRGGRPSGPSRGCAPAAGASRAPPRARRCRPCRWRASARARAAARRCARAG